MTERVTLRFSVQQRVVPAVRMTQRSKFVSRQAKRYLAYKEQIGWAAKQAGASIMAGPITLRVDVYVARRRWDASNVLKAVEDALNGVCWKDDYEITEAHIFVEDCPGQQFVDVLDVEVSGRGQDDGPAWAMAERGVSR